MTDLGDSGTLDLGPLQLEYRMIGPRPSAPPTLILLHEGLGSAGLWGDFPDELAKATGVGVFAYSRPGYGSSSPVELPRPLTYMHEEADRLPELLEAIGFRRGLLVGHSDGASIAALYLGRHQDHRIRGVSLIAPHFVVEDVSLAAIGKAKEAYLSGDLKPKLARWHKDPDNAFWGWNAAWLDPDFKSWDISDSLGYIRVPVQIIQGEADQYGTRRQIEIAEEECYCPVEVTWIPKVGHSPHREAPDVTVEAVAGFANRILIAHGEAALQPQVQA